MALPVAFFATFTISHFSPRNIFVLGHSFILCGFQYLVLIPILLSCIARIAILTKMSCTIFKAVFEKIAFEDFTSGEKYSNIAHCNTDKNVMHTVLSPIILSDSKYPRSAPPDFRNKYFNYCRIAGTGTDSETVTPLYYQQKIFIIVSFAPIWSIFFLFIIGSLALILSAENICQILFSSSVLPQFWSRRWLVGRLTNSD